MVLTPPLFFFWLMTAEKCSFYGKKKIQAHPLSSLLWFIINVYIFTTNCLSFCLLEENWYYNWIVYMTTLLYFSFCKHFFLIEVAYLILIALVTEYEFSFILLLQSPILPFVNKKKKFFLVTVTIGVHLKLFAKVFFQDFCSWGNCLIITETFVL